MKNGIFLFFFLLCTIVNAQSNFQNGYIITLEKDTVYGQINYQTDPDNMSKCIFRKTPDSKTETFSPRNLWGYRFTESGKFYISHDIKIKDIQKKVFVEYLVNGDLNLYFYHDIDTFQDYYFFEKDQETVPITKKADQHIDGHIQKDINYVGRLKYIFRDKPEISQGINNQGFSRKTMIDYAKLYNTSSGQSSRLYIESEEKEKNVSVGISVYAGLRHTTYAYDHYFKNKLKDGKSAFPLVGAQLNFLYPRWSNSISLLIDISFTGFDTKSSGNYRVVYDAPMVYSDIFAEYKLKSLMGNAKIGIKYTYPTGKIRPFVEGGFSSSFLMSKSSEYDHTVLETKINEESFSGEGDGPNTVFIGLYAGAGANYQIKNNSFLSLRFTYEQTTETNPLQISLDLYGKDKMKGLQFSLGYIF